MISKIEKFKTAAWKKAGKYNTGRGQRILPAALIGVGTIAWTLLRFAGTVLDVVFGIERENSSSPLYLQEDDDELDFFGRSPEDSFYGRSLSNADLLEEIEEYEDRRSW